MNPISFDRKIAKGNIGLLIIVILLLPIIMSLIGLCFQMLLSKHELLFSFDSIKDNVFWDTYENYINPEAHPNLSFSHRLYMLITGIFGIFLLNGILVSAIVSWVDKRSERWNSGDLRYDRKRWFQKSLALNNYVIIIGGNEMVPELIRQLLTDKSLYVLIMTDCDVPNLRKNITSILKEDEERVVIYYGERTHIEDLRHLQIERANSIYVIGEQLDVEQSSSHHDVKNMECVKLISQLLHESIGETGSVRTSYSRKLCRVMFEYQSTFSVFQFTDIDGTISSVLDFRPFNYYETWAQNVLVCHTLNPDKETCNYLPLEGKRPITPESSDTVHLIIVGMSRMGVSLGMEAAHIAHYPNFVCNGNLRTRITFIDSAARKEMQYMQGQYKELFALSRWRYIEAAGDNIYYNESGDIPYNDLWKAPLRDKSSHSPYRDTRDYTLGQEIVDIDWEFIQGDLEMPAIQCYIRDASMRKNERVTIAICFPKDNASFAASLYLPDEVYDDDNNVIQVLAYQPHGDAMCQCFKGKIEMNGNTMGKQQNNFNQFAKLKAFGMMDRCYNIRNQQNMELAATQIWEQYNQTYKSRIGGRNTYRAKLGMEVTLKAGKSLAASQWSNNYAAAHLWTKLRSIKWNGKDKIDEESLSVLAKLEHIRWNMEQLLLGYAPLRPEEQYSIRKKLETAERVETPLEELIQLSGSDTAKMEQEQILRIKKWLDAWKAFDEEREILKANMSHMDICSSEILEKLDKESIKYDEDLTRILPLIYYHIKENQK